MDFPASQKEFNTQTFKKLVHKAERFQHKEFTSCTFVKCNFSESVFDECAFHECIFKDCELNLIKLGGSSFSTTRFENCHMLGVNWTETEMAGSKIHFGKPVDFVGCVLNHSIFMWLNLKDILLTRCTVHDADFSEADLTNADCTRSDFANSRFWHTNLTGANFVGATNYTIAANLNTLKKTKFSLPEAMSLLTSLDIILSDD